MEGGGAKRRMVLAYPLEGLEGKERVERREVAVARTEEEAFS